MKPASAKAKGRRLQQAVVRQLLDLFPHLEADDITSRSMGAGGEDILLSPAARAVLPITVECKNQETLSIWQAMAQARAHSSTFAPVLFFKRNGTPTYACLPAATLLELYRDLYLLRTGATVKPFYESERLFETDDDTRPETLSLVLTDGSYRIESEAAELVLAFTDVDGQMKTSLFVTPEGAAVLVGAIFSSLTTSFGAPLAAVVVAEAVRLQGDGPQEVEFQSGEVFGDD